MVCVVLTASEINFLVSILRCWFIPLSGTRPETCIGETLPCMPKFIKEYLDYLFTVLSIGFHGGEVFGGCATPALMMK